MGKFKFNNSTCFCVEDIIYYKGKHIYKNTFLDKLNILNNLFKYDLSQNAITSNYVIFGLPIIHNDFNQLLNQIELLPYKIKYIKFKNSHNNNTLCMNYFKPNPNKNVTSKVFVVKPDIQSDIYKLFLYDNVTQNEEYYDLAYIPDFKTSMMMNKIFRKIKENDNLDLLEESDSEEEFQNENIDKFVMLDKKVTMLCHYNNKFKRWVPVNKYNDKYNDKYRRN